MRTILPILAILFMLSCSQKSNHQIIESDSETIPELSSQKKKAYLELAELCLNTLDYQRMVPVINSLKNYDNSEIMNSTLYYVIDYTYENKIPFLCHLDYKEEVKQLHWHIKEALKKNFNVKLKLPSAEQFDSDASISWDGVFESYHMILYKNGFLMTCIDNGSTDYILLIHKLEDKEHIKNAIVNIGYSCYTLDSN